MQKPSWKIRRRIIHATLIFCAFCVLWIMVRGDDRAVNEVIVMCAFGLAFAVIGSYIFGAVWDDKNFMSTVRNKGLADTSQTYDDSGGFPPDPHGGT